MPKKECWYNTLPCVEWATPGLFRILKRFLSPEADKQAQSKQHYISPDKTVSIFSHLSLYRRLWQVARNSAVDLGKQLGKLGTFSSVSPPTNRRIVTGSTEDHGKSPWEAKNCVTSQWISFQGWLYKYKRECWLEKIPHTGDNGSINQCG